MARKSARKAKRPTRADAPRRIAPPAAPTTDREKIVAALLTLLAEQSFESVGLADVAAAAGVSLAQLRGEFSSTLAIFAAHMKAADRAVLAQDFSDMAEESARERLFDVLMRRLDVLAPHRQAIRSVLRSARRNPPLAFALNGLAVRSQRWMLAAAGIGSSGPSAALRAQGLAALFASVLRTWIDDNDEAQARTMAALDRALGRGQQLIGLVEGLCMVPATLARFGRRRRADDDFEDATAE
jgi:AcrR family transcriptional regulator